MTSNTQLNSNSNSKAYSTNYVDEEVHTVCVIYLFGY